MATVRNAVAYLCKKYPHWQDVTKTRLTKLLYLADWHCAMTSGRQVTEIGWQPSRLGPASEEVSQAIASDPAFEVELIHKSIEQNFRVRFRGVLDELSIQENERASLDFAIEVSSSRRWDEFDALVNATYPLIAITVTKPLDLVRLAAEYKKIYEAMPVLTEPQPA